MRTSHALRRLAGDGPDEMPPGLHAVPTDGSLADRLTKERDFHDSLAAELGREVLPPVLPDELERDMFALAGSLQGKDVLDLGCGTGDITLQLLARGARVTAVDISPGMVALTGRRAARFRPNREVCLEAAPAEALSLADDSIDLVIGKWILHHVDVEAAVQEVARVLRPGGRAIFIENSGVNPLLAFARRYLAGRFGIPRFGTEDEQPLVHRDFSLIADSFGRCELHYPDFCFFQLFDRQIFRFRWSLATRAVRWLDDFVWCRLPRFRRYSFHVIIEVGKH